MSDGVAGTELKNAVGANTFPTPPASAKCDGALSRNSMTDRLRKFRLRPRRAENDENDESVLHQSSAWGPETKRSKRVSDVGDDMCEGKEIQKESAQREDGEEEEEIEDERDIEIDALRFANQVLLQQLKELREKHRDQISKKDEAMKAYQEQFASEIVKLQSSMQQGIQACYAQITSLKEQLRQAKEENEV